MVRFDGRTPRAETWIREQSSRLIREVTEETKALARDRIERNLAAGNNPKAIVTDLVGAYDRQEKRRVGGIIGLTEQQTGWSDTALKELTSGDPRQLANYLKREARDKRFDRTVVRSIEMGRPIEIGKARVMQRRYRDGLLAYRAEVIARTETLRGLHAAQEEGLRQVVEAGHLRQDQVTRKWDATGDKKTRSSHMSMEGQARAVGEPFQFPGGGLAMHPGDPSMGAPAHETIQCRCVARVELDLLKGL